MGYFTVGVTTPIAVANLVNEKIINASKIGFDCLYKTGYSEFKPLALTTTRLLGLFDLQKGEAKYFKLINDSRMEVKTISIDKEEFTKTIKLDLLARYLREHKLIGPLKKRGCVEFVEKYRVNLVEQRGAEQKIVETVSRKERIKIRIAWEGARVHIGIHEEELVGPLDPFLSMYETINCRVFVEPDPLNKLEEFLKYVSELRSEIEWLLRRQGELKLQLKVQRFKMKLDQADLDSLSPLSQELEKVQCRLSKLLPLEELPEVI